MSMPVLLRHWREKRGLSTRQLAKLAEVGFVTISRIENDHISPTVTMLERLAKALDIDLRDFFPKQQESTRKRGKR
jgi:transcriptional regulator with XRE-family HTH domain